jgi:hypothetical protein
MIIESAIKAALRKVGAGEKTRLELRDKGARGAGRLVLIIRAIGDRRTSAEFYAVYQRDGKRAMSKLGTYPLLSLVDARKRFGRNSRQRQRLRGARQRGRQATPSQERRDRWRAVGRLCGEPAGGRQAIGRQSRSGIVTASGEDFTATDDPARVKMRQIAAAFAQYEKARLVAKLKGARDRKSATLGKRIEGRKGYDDTNPALVRQAKRLARNSPKTRKARSLREIAGELARLGFKTWKGLPFSPSQVQRLVRYSAS